METQKIIDVVQKVTGVNIFQNNRKRVTVECRALFCKVMKEIKPTITLEKLGEIIKKDHATVIHLLKKYEIYAKYSPTLNTQLEEILSILKYEIKKDDLQNDFYTLRLKNIIRTLREEVSTLRKEVKIKDDELNKPRNKYYIIERLDRLLTDLAGTEQQEVLLEKLNAFYNINNKLNLYKKHYNQY